MRSLLKRVRAHFEAKSRERAQQLCGNPCTTGDGRVGRGMGVCLHCGNLLVRTGGDRNG